jgi:hypothetical protein
MGLFFKVVHKKVLLINPGPECQHVAKNRPGLYPIAGLSHALLQTKLKIRAGLTGWALIGQYLKKRPTCPLAFDFFPKCQ